ncbi:MAG: ABC transporter substrate-binding protein [Clostridiales bacterium]|nr:ABC transporter substrate-binding protein [Clostridiales bacterium]
MIKTKKLTRVLLAAVMSVVTASALTACGPGTPADTGEAQGVFADKIIVGNTAATTGDFAGVGVPFNYGLQAAFKEYNDTFYGPKVELKHYDDGFDGAQGLTYTKQLVEEDKIFALVGHFGTNTVSATTEYIVEKGIPMVYAATGITALYNENAVGNQKALMSVQPIYNTEGRALVARALATGENGAGTGMLYGLGATKLGVISTTDDAGVGILAGIDRQLQETKTAFASTVVKQQFDPAATDISAQITALKTAGCDVIIAACNQAPLVKVLNAMKNASYNASVVTSYVSASPTTLGNLVNDGSITENRKVYTTAWLDTGTPDGLAGYLQFAAVMTAYETANGITAGTYALNSYAMAGYVAGNLFVNGLKRVGAAGDKLTWANYIKAMESAPIAIPMGGSVNYANGSRLGIADLAFNTIGIEPTSGTGVDAVHALVAVDHITSLGDLWAQVPAGIKK